ncbi:glycosyltransferase family 9 protein [Nisaea acidiphila]|uniref:Glycosyltransferase family 9 protein n=1 Tax=Nisaea acidiphila TaxID=1862145 RepID=A0A9J7AWY9_9PROT|nr:glycosyltransferase family 9 protein [Nisaea acidiphila]UUX51314.1 glycosyltransferase family 9 protein [Nisaea acidiphila]
MPADSTLRRILVIKLGALGDFIYAVGPMQAIRRHHPNAEITLLTRPAYAELGERTELFDQVWTDREPKLWNLPGLIALRSRLIGGRFDRIYDLQTSDRTGLYHRLFWPGNAPEWSGIVPGCSHYHHYKRPTLIHTQDRQRTQLEIAGIEDVRASDLSFMTSDIARFGLPADFALLIPGSSLKMAVKRWPAEFYGAIAKQFEEQGLLPVLIGGTEDADAIATIKSICPTARDLSGQTTLYDLPELARAACLAIGNDTGPMHIAALAGCQTVAIFSTGSFPDKAAPRGDNVQLLVAECLTELSVETVTQACENLLTNSSARI